MFVRACKVGLEGVVSKVRDIRYPSGRGRDWVKTTCAQRETLTIAGFALDGNDWDGIYLGRRKGEDLIYAGKVDYGFDKKSSAELRKRLTPLIRKTQPYTRRIAHKAIGLSRNCSPKSSTARSPPRERSAIPFTKVYARIYEHNAIQDRQRGHGERYSVIPTGPIGSTH